VAVSELGRQLAGGVGRAPEADADASPGAGKGGGDRAPDPRAGAGDDRAQTGERRLSGLRNRRLEAGRR